MKKLCDTVTYAEAVKLKNYGCKVETDMAYKIDDCDKGKIKLVKFISSRDWNSEGSRVFSAPTYAEVIDWMIENKNNDFYSELQGFCLELQGFLRNFGLYLLKDIQTKQKCLTDKTE